MICRQRRDRTVGQHFPHYFLILFVAQRRRHHVFRAFEIRFRCGAIEQEILNERLNPDVYTALFAAHRFGQGFLATGVHGVNMRAGHFGKCHQMMHAFGFDDWRTAPVMIFRSGLAFAQKFLLQFQNQIGILAMHCCDDAELLR